MNKETSSKENDWFRNNEKTMIEKSRLEREKKIKQKMAKDENDNLEKTRLAHYLKCPKCGHDMKTSHMDDIEIEQCGFCSGIHFDRGELENLLLKKKDVRFQIFRNFFDLD